jgi:hypothetical protein
VGTARETCSSGEGEVTEDRDDFRAVGTLRIPPDPGILKALGLNHAFESAISDLVDNSVDAEARHVLVRFVLRTGLVERVLVVDDGSGMDSNHIDTAMQLGRPKEDSSRKLGHFGMGLKSASLSQASVLTVLSRSQGGKAQGRRMTREGQGTGFECDVLAEEQVSAALDAGWPGFNTEHGTVIRWDELRGFPASTDSAVTAAFVETKQNELRHHLGLMFHRLLEEERVSVAIDVFDADLQESGLVFPVEPINPFAYIQSGVRGYPKTLWANFDGKKIPLQCHIWPGSSDSQYFKLFGATVDRFQGFYLYRNDRLLSAGGWGGVVDDNKRRKLARVSIDIQDHLDAFSMSMEKTGVRMIADLVRAIEVAQADDGTSFQEYLAVAEETFKESNKRVQKRRPIIPPGAGLHPRVKKAIAGELKFIEGEESVEIRWTRLPGEDFVEIDRNQRILWLNSRYRPAILKGTHGGMNDVPLIKALLFVLYEDIFRGTAFGARDKDNASMWQQILTAAAEAELYEFGE